MEPTEAPVYTLNITGAEKLNVQADDTTILSVSFEILKNGEHDVTYTHGFPLETSEVDVRASLAEFLANYEATREVWKRNEAFTVANAAADETIAKLVGEPIINEEETPTA